jgi:pimeloyl-ACP methyl ester carboxylesterase
MAGVTHPGCLFEVGLQIPLRLRKVHEAAPPFAAYEGKDGGLHLIRAARDLDSSQTKHIGEVLRTSGVPALVLWGERDTIFPVDKVARPLADLLQAHLVLLPGGHFTPVDCPGE